MPAYLLHLTELAGSLNSSDGASCIICVTGDAYTDFGRRKGSKRGRRRRRRSNRNAKDVTIKVRKKGEGEKNAVNACSMADGAAHVHVFMKIALEFILVQPQGAGLLNVRWRSSQYRHLTFSVQCDSNCI